MTSSTRCLLVWLGVAMQPVVAINGMKQALDDMEYYFSGELFSDKRYQEIVDCATKKSEQVIRKQRVMKSKSGATRQG